MITSTIELMNEIIEYTDDLIDYARSSSGDPTLHKWLLELRVKVAKLYGITVGPITQQGEEE